MRTSPFRLASALLGTVFSLWVVFATVVMPHLYQSVYSGGLPFLGRFLVRHRVENGVVHPLESYLYQWSELAQRLTVSLLLFGLLGLVIVKALETRTFFDKFVGNAQSGMLGAIRMWTCAILLVSTCCEQLDSAAFLPAEMRRPMGLMTLLDILPTGFDRFVASGPSLWAFQIITEVLLFLGMIGCWTRLVVPLAALCAYVFNGILREFSFFWHQNLVPIYVLAVLSFTPCGDGWSLDRLRSIYKGRPVPDGERAAPIYGWSRYACWLPIALLYCWSGLSKLRQSGLMWASPTNMRTVMYEESLSGRWYPLGQGLHIAWAPDFVFVLFGLAAISGELVYPSVLFSRRARRIVPLMMMGMHIGIIVLQDIVFLDLIALNLILLDFSSLRDAIARRLARRGPLQILYDGSCKYCRGTVRVLTAMDLFRRLTVTDFRRLDLEEFNRANGCALDAEALEHEMALVSRGRVYSGFRAYRVLSTAIPALWIVAPLLYVPGVAPLGTLVYKYVALRRHGHARCNEVCKAEAVSASVFSVPELMTAQRFGYVLGLSGLAIVMSVAFFFKIEFYPFTAMQLFTGLRTSEVIYYRVLGERESGELSPVRIEDAIPLTSFNGRYSPALEACFGNPAEKQICGKFLAASLTVYNRKSRPHDRLIGYEVDKVIWDYHVSPDDPMHGRTAERFALKAGGLSSRVPPGPDKSPTNSE
jgi:predicted DCC family thiol-disulfide oxidoreductase YuxK